MKECWQKTEGVHKTIQKHLWGTSLNDICPSETASQLSSALCFNINISHITAPQRQRSHCDLNCYFIGDLLIQSPTYFLTLGFGLKTATYLYKDRNITYVEQCHLNTLWTKFSNCHDELAGQRVQPEYAVLITLMK